MPASRLRPAVKSMICSPTIGTLTNTFQRRGRMTCESKKGVTSRSVLRGDRLRRLRSTPFTLSADSRRYQVHAHHRP